LVRPNFAAVSPGNNPAAAVLFSSFRSLSRLSLANGVNFLQRSADRLDGNSFMANRTSGFVDITPEVLLKAYACGI
jgi:hypothetical protein